MLCPLPAEVAHSEQAGSRHRWSSRVYSPASPASPAALTTPLDHKTQIQFPAAGPEAELGKAAHGQLLDALLDPLNMRNCQVVNSFDKYLPDKPFSPVFLRRVGIFSVC